MGRFRVVSRVHGTIASGQRGAVAIIVAISLAVMIGFAGLALDLGRLYVNKTELQSAADACALAASRELICDTSKGGVACPAKFLENAEIAGRYAANRNLRDLQSSDVAIPSADVRFSTDIAPNSTYSSRGSADPSSKFVMCVARSEGIVPWLMGVVGLGAANNVVASAVATLAPARNFCLGPPIGVCKATPTSSEHEPYGYKAGDWIRGDFAGGPSLNKKTWRWVDFSANPGGTSELDDGLTGQDGICGLQVSDQVQEAGTKQGTKDAYNTRFGIYTGGGGLNAYTADNAPPDRTGYAYPNKSPGFPVIAEGTSAYLDYRARQATATPFIPNHLDETTDNSDPPKLVKNSDKVNGSPSTTTVHQTKGGNRRLNAVPVIEPCGEPGVKPRIVGSACVLMLNPMSNGASGSIFLEYLGKGSDPDSPCAAFGSPGGGLAGLGPMVPTLVQ